ncbi:MAG TPA: NB-ARC domain-containing protein [Ktedonobacteraceae bacterium]|nr:NB-ARC domain-containing protein [Ktedonobacteraceae bacterium]
MESPSYQRNSSGQKEGALREDWGQSPNVQVFYGRQAELATLERWIVSDHCQMVVVFGIGGIGKTTLAAKLAEQIKGEFGSVFWRSLQHAPTLKTLLSECIQFLSDEKKIDLPENVEDQIAQLIGYFRRHRCLVVLDNVESILQKGQMAGQYREGYEGYGVLFPPFR